MPDHIILLLHSAVFALSNNSIEVKNESVGWQDVARNIGLGAHAASGLKSCSKIRPTTKKLCYVKEEVFEITDGGPIIDTDHPVIKEMFEIPIAGALCCSLNLYGLFLSNPLIAAAAALGWQVITNQRFCLRREENQGKPRCFRTGCIQASKSSSIFSVRTALHRRQFFPFSFDPVWRTNCGTGGGPPGHKMYTMLFIHPGLEHQPWYGRSSPQS